LNFLLRNQNNPLGVQAQMMLNEHFIASIGVPSKASTSTATKDAGIFLHEFQPVTRQQTIFKKSATAPNCLAVSPDHVFAAQADKGVVHVYNREKGNQEATVPFTERITCLTLACEDAVLVLGTAEGRVFLCEIASGRQLTTSRAHLQEVTKVVVDPSGNFLLSASKDSTVHVWSLPALLSFSTDAGSKRLSPLQTFTLHRAEVGALAVGHSVGFANIAVTASKDKTCLVWDYHSNTLLRTYLLDAVPVSLVLDAADRAVYLGYDDGSVQQLDLYKNQEALRDAKDPTTPVQPAPSSHWKPSDATVGAALSLTLSLDSCTLFSGHSSGAILAWDVASGRHRNLLQNPLPGPVTNLESLPVSGFVGTTSKRPFRIPAIIKPKFGAFDNGGDGSVPGNYTLNVELSSNLQSVNGLSEFEQALTAPCFSQDLIDEGLTELASWNQQPAKHAQQNEAVDEGEDFMALDGGPSKAQQPGLEEQNVALKKQIEALRRLQTASFEKMEKIHAERRALLEREQKRLKKSEGGGVNGVNDRTDESDADEEMDEVDSEDDEDDEDESDTDS
jgi:pre-rRNA-processing protein IPI3